VESEFCIKQSPNIKSSGIHNKTVKK